MWGQIKWNSMKFVCNTCKQYVKKSLHVTSPIMLLAVDFFSNKLIFEYNTASVFFKFLRSRSFVKSRRLWDLIKIISSTYPDLWGNESSRRNLAEKAANFAGCRLLYTTLYSQLHTYHYNITAYKTWITQHNYFTFILLLQLDWWDHKQTKICIVQNHIEIIWKLSSCPGWSVSIFCLVKDHTWAASVESISSSCSQSSENEGRVLAVSPQHFSIIS